MTTSYLAPDPIQSTQFIPGTNTPASGGLLFFYVAGTSTKQTVYKDNLAATPWTNPIVLDSGGNLPSGGVVWFPTGQTFRVVFAPSNDSDPPASPYWSKDNLSGINDIAFAQDEWIDGPAPTFVSATSFTLAGDQTATFTKGRRVRSTNTGGTIYSTIINSAFSVATTVDVVNDSGVLDSGLSAVAYSLLDPANRSIDEFYIYRKGLAVSSGANGTTDIWGTTGDYVHITGTNTIASFSTAPYAGSFRTLIFDSALILNHSAALRIPGSQNVTTKPNDCLQVRADTVSTAVVVNYSGSSQIYPPIQRLISTVILSVSTTWTKNTSTNNLIVWAIGGGGGGGGASTAAGGNQVSAGGGGGGGGGAMAMLVGYSSTSEVATVGPGGTGGASGNGNDGSTTSFGSLVVATGGVAGGGIGSIHVSTLTRVGGTGGTSGSGSTGALLMAGQDGSEGYMLNSSGAGGLGGSSPFGGGGRGGRSGHPGATAGGQSGGAYGGGGGGAIRMDLAQGQTAGGNGGNGVILIYEYS